MDDPWALMIVTELRRMGITQREFCNLCGYSEPYLSQILRGKRATRHSKEKIDAVLDSLKKRQEIVDPKGGSMNGWEI